MIASVSFTLRMTGYILTTVSAAASCRGHDSELIQGSYRVIEAKGGGSPLSAAIGDIDNDGVPDLVVGSVQSDPDSPEPIRVRVFSGRTGKETFEVDTGFSATWSRTIVTPCEDLDNDGVDDFMVHDPRALVEGVPCGMLLVVSGKSHDSILSLSPGVGESMFAQAATTIHRGSERVVIVTSNKSVQNATRSSIRCVDSDGQLVFENVLFFNYTSESEQFLCAAGDQDGDGQDDFLFANNQTAACLSGIDGKEIGVIELDSSIAGLAELADYDGDGKPECYVIGLGVAAMITPGLGQVSYLWHGKGAASPYCNLDARPGTEFFVAQVEEIGSNPFDRLVVQLDVFSIEYCEGEAASSSSFSQQPPRPRFERKLGLSAAPIFVRPSRASDFDGDGLSELLVSLDDRVVILRGSALSGR